MEPWRSSHVPCRALWYRHLSPVAQADSPWLPTRSRESWGSERPPNLQAGKVHNVVAFVGAVVARRGCHLAYLRGAVSQSVRVVGRPTCRIGRGRTEGSITIRPPAFSAAFHAAAFSPEGLAKQSGNSMKDSQITPLLSSRRSCRWPPRRRTRRCRTGRRPRCRQRSPPTPGCPAGQGSC